MPLIRKLSLAVTLMGILLLFAILLFSSPVAVTNDDALSSLLPNQKVITTGKVLSERQYDSLKILKLDNNITLICNSCSALQNLKNKTVDVLGCTEIYLNKTEIQILRVIRHD